MNERPAGSGLLTGLGDGRLDQLIAERLLAPPAHRTGSRLLSDPLRTSSREAEDRQKSQTFFRQGFVVQAIPHRQCYRVALDDQGGVIRCARADYDGRLPLGGRTVGVLAAHTRVLVFKPHGSTTGYIVAVLPPDVLDPMVYRPGFIWPGGEAGYYRDGGHNALSRLANGGEIRDFGAGAPIDETQLDRGLVYETGLMLQADPFMLQMKVNEFSGLLMTLWDAYVRLGGVNFDFATGIHDQEVRLDEGELRGRMGKSVYFHEALGLFAPGALGETKDMDEVLRSKPEALYDLKASQRDVVPVYRAIEYDGYEGQGGLRTVVVPKGDGDANHRGQDNGTTVFMESIGLDGGYTLASAKQLAFLKRSALPCPREVNRPEDTRGDTQQDYKFAGLYGEGDAHKIGDIEYSERTGPGILATIDDLLAHAVNWRAVHPFHYHTKDYSLPELAESAIGPAQEPLTFSQAPAPLPVPKVLRIDHRWLRGQYYSRSAGLVFTDDGGTVHFDGYGNRISMGPEGVKIESPNRIMLISGGDIIDIGKQIVLKAHDSVDVTAVNKDLRLFAGKNLHSSGDGVLIEGRSEERAYDYDNKIGEEVTSSSVIIRSKTDVALLGDNIYARSGVGAEETGDIVLDANKREGNIYYEAFSVVGFITGSFDIYTQAIGGDLQQTISFGTDTALIDCSLIVGNDIAVTGDDPNVFVEGSIVAKGDIQCTGGMANRDGAVGRVSEKLKPKLEESLIELETTIKEFTDASTEIDNEIWQDGWHVDQNIGSDGVLEKLAFSFRDDDNGVQYGVSTLSISEARWVTLTRLGGAGGTKEWEEEPITYQGKELHSWPGKKNWSDLTPLVRPVAADGNLYDMSVGVEKDRGDRYENPRVPAPEKVSFREGMRVLQ